VANSVSGDTHTGAFVGEDYNGIGHFTACFWDASVNPTLPGIGNSADPHGTGKTTAQMQQQATFTGRDFINIWAIGENQTYPYLRTHAAADINADNVVNLLDLCIMAQQWLK